MRKFAFRIFACILVGATVNVGVAWWFTATIELEANPGYTFSTRIFHRVVSPERVDHGIEAPRHWPGELKNADPGLFVGVADSRSNYGFTDYVVIAAHSMPHTTPVYLPNAAEAPGYYLDGQSEFAAYIEGRAGWPLPTLRWRDHGRWGTWSYRVSMANGDTHYKLRSVDREARTGMGPLVISSRPVSIAGKTFFLNELPVSPMLRGSVINTLLYASPFLLCVLIPPAWRWRKAYHRRREERLRSAAV